MPKEAMQFLGGGSIEYVASLKSAPFRYVYPSAYLAEHLGERLKRLMRFPVGKHNGVCQLVGITEGIRREREVSFAESGESLHGLWIVLLESVKIEGEFLTTNVHDGYYVSLVLPLLEGRTELGKG
jgi:hypothetical protein